MLSHLKLTSLCDSRPHLFHNLYTCRPTRLLPSVRYFRHMCWLYHCSKFSVIDETAVGFIKESVCQHVSLQRCIRFLLIRSILLTAYTRETCRWRPLQPDLINNFVSCGLSLLNPVVWQAAAQWEVMSLGDYESTDGSLPQSTSFKCRPLVRWLGHGEWRVGFVANGRLIMEIQRKALF